MNQEMSSIEVYLEESDGKDYMVFGFEEKQQVCMNNENSQNELKSLFIYILESLLTSNIELVYKENPGYKKGLFKDVCKEYIKELNREILEVKSNIPEGLTEIKI